MVYDLTLFDMGFFWTVSHGGTPQDNFVVIVPMTMKLYTVAAKHLWRDYYYVTMTS